MNLADKQELMKTRLDLKKKKKKSKQAKARFNPLRYKHQECQICGQSLLSFPARNTKLCPDCRGIGARTWKDAKIKRLVARLEKYNIPMDVYRAVLQVQDWCCAICGKWGGNDGLKLVIDHDHETQQFRGLLCGRCNTGLGQFEDDLYYIDRARTYLSQRTALPERLQLAGITRDRNKLATEALSFGMARPAEEITFG